jgi:hypothetical protein
MCQVIVLLCGSLGSYEQGDSLSLDDIVRANENAIASITSLKFVARIDGARGRTDVRLAYYWRADDTAKLITDPLTPPGPNGDRLDYEEWFHDRDSVETLVGYPRDHPPRLGDDSTTKAHGVIAARNKLVVDVMPRSPRAMLMLRVYNFGPSKSLKELVAGAKSARIIGTPSSSARKCYELDIDFSEKFHANVSVDPSNNFMIRRIEHRAAVKGITKPYHEISVREATAFHRFPDGSCLPEKIQVSIGDDISPGGDKRESTIIFESLMCNEPISPSELAFSFPEALTVVDDTTGMVHIWGADGKPARSFKSGKEFEAWDRPRFLKASKALVRSENIGRYKVYVALLFPLVCLIVYIIYRKRYTRGGTASIA